MAMFNNTTERFLLTALIAALVSWAWSMRLMPENPLGEGMDWAVSMPVMLLLTLCAFLIGSKIWNGGSSRRQFIAPRQFALNDL